MHKDRFRPCIIIPVYNHSAQIKTICQNIAEKKLHCILVDDGSNAQCANVLQAIAENNENIELIRLDENQGKGVAVCTGLVHALRSNYSHALQIDADGQHSLSDIEAFFNCAQNNPAAVISGFRRYEDLPPSRRYGRMFTDMWVWIHTWSRTIKDSMCGYRLYPLPATVALIESTAIGRRMDFDTDILVKLFWRGLEVQHININVKYEDDIISHFDVWKDNLRVTKMHTKLFFGMLRRLPNILTRKWRGKSNER